MADTAGRISADVLLVEDDPADVLLVQEAFEPYAVRNTLHVVADGEQALQFLRQEGRFSGVPRPGLVLLDLNLPRRNGLEVLAEMRADSGLAAIPVVILTTSRAPQESCAATGCMPAPISASRQTMTSSPPRSAASAASISGSPSCQASPRTHGRGPDR